MDEWKAHGLPQRQAAVLEDIARGLTYKECAQKQGVSTAVINSTIQTLFYKLHLAEGRRSLLVASAIRKGYLRTLLIITLCVLSCMPSVRSYRSPIRTQTRVSQAVRARSRDEFHEEIPA